MHTHTYIYMIYMYSRDYIGIIFLYFLLTTSRLMCLGGFKLRFRVYGFGFRV